MPRAGRPATQRSTQARDQATRASSEAGSGDESGGEHRENALERDACALVRLALFAETRRTTLKRDEISKKALTSGSRAFNSILARAQEILKETFGMELVEVMSKAERDAQEKGGDAETSKRKAAPASKAYVLRSMLDPALIDAANVQYEDLRIEENNTLQHEDSDDIEFNSGGCILAWQTADRLGSIGMLSVILALILVNGKELSDMQLRGYLKSLRLPPNAKVPFKTLTVEALKTTIPIETFLSNMVRHGYLEKLKANTPGPNATQAPNNKRGRGSKSAEGEGDAAFLWRWGARSLVEFGETAIVDFITSFMLERRSLMSDDEDEDEDEGRGNAARIRENREKEAETMRTSILKAAGTPLNS